MLGEHLFGLYEKALDPSDTWERRLSKAAKLGFDYMEICIDEQDARLARLEWSRAQIEDLRAAAVREGVPLLTLCLSGHRRFPFGSADPKTRQRAYDIMDKAIDFASAMGSRVIQMAGYDVYYEPSTAESRRLFMQGLKWAAGRAARKQVMLGMEIMDTDFYTSITKHLEFEWEVNSPWFHVYPDIGNLSAWGNDVEREFAKGIGSIVSVHVKETHAVTQDCPGQFRDVPFGTGCVDFAKCFGKLEALGYTGPYLMEMWHSEGTDDVEEAAKARDFVRGRFELAMRTYQG